MQGKFSAAGWWCGSQKLKGPSLETTTRTIRAALDQLVCSSSIYGTLYSRHTNSETMRTMCFLLIAKHCYEAGGVDGVKH